MRSRRHRHKSSRSALLAGGMGNLAQIRAHPTRFAVLGGLGLALALMVSTTSLPYALAPSFPDLALSLNPNNPVALLAKAEKARDQLLKLSGATEQAAPKENASGPVRADTIAHLPAASSEGELEPQDEREALRREIRRLAVRTIANEPLNAKAFRLLAEVTHSPEQVRVLMQEAIRRSRRESVALFWLLHDSIYHKDYKAGLSYSDALLRTRPELSAYVFGYLTRMAEDRDGNALLIQDLAKGPAWRRSFFEALPRNTQQTEIPLKLMIALKESGKPVADKELAPYLNALIARNLVDNAYNVWLQFLPKAELDSLGLISHPDFEHDPTGLPFDWKIAQGVNAIAEFVPNGERERALHITFGYGRVQFPEASQVVLLPPGKYRIEGKVRGKITAKRGLRWQVRCASGPKRVLGETDMLMGHSPQWRVFALEAEVPLIEECRGQTLRLFHDSRSASEELISGEAWFAGLRLERLREATASQ